MGWLPFFIGANLLSPGLKPSQWDTVFVMDRWHRIYSVRLCEEKVEDWFGKFWFVPVAIVGTANDNLDQVVHVSDKSKRHQPSKYDGCDMTGCNRSLMSRTNSPSRSAKRGRPTCSHDRSTHADERPDSKAGRAKSHRSAEAIPEKGEALRQFTNNIQDLLEKVLPTINTQICESFHSGKAKLEPKDING
jgi:hypothetical protein